MIPIAIYHCNISIVSRGKGKSAVAAAAYRSGEKLTNEWDGMTHDYTRKGGVVHTEILLPPHAPPSFSDRSTLWNSVELYEKAGNAQLAREIDAALPIELSREEQIRLVREYCSSQFVSKGMCVDFAIHDTDSGNPHCHIMQEYIYKIEANPRTTGDNDRFFLQAYLPQENGRAKIGDVLYIGSLAKCRELMGGLNAGELTQGEVKELYAKAQEAEADKDTFSIYQLKQGDETRDFRFEPYDRLQAAGNVVDKTNYELVYSAELTPGTSLEDIYTRFNIDHPKDFKGHSLSVSDVVVLHQNGQDAAHYVDSFGYKEVPEFLQEQTQQPEKINPLKHVEDTIEQNDNNFDGIINNTPTVDELEAKVKAGEQISLVDLAEAIKADKERGKEKPSIRAQLKADKERTGKKKNAKQKSQDLERS